jgi:hypothetical protein
MNYEIRAQDGYIGIVCSGPYDQEAARRCVDEAFALCEAHAIGRIYIDGRGFTTPVTMAERFDLATTLAARRRTQLRIAFVMQECKEFTHALENMANNRGVPVKTTSSETEAWEWLGMPVPT